MRSRPVFAEDRCVHVFVRLPRQAPNNSIARVIVCEVNRPFCLGTGDGNRQVGFTRGAVNVRVPRDKKSVLDRGTESFNNSRIRLRAGQRLLVNVSRFHRAEDDHEY